MNKLDKEALRGAAITCLMLAAFLGLGSIVSVWVGANELNVVWVDMGIILGFGSLGMLIIGSWLESYWRRN